MSPDIAKELARVVDLYVCGYTTPERLIAIADKVLVDSTYTESLGELTSLRNRPMFEIRPVFESAIGELGMTLPDKSEAAVRVVRECALQVVRDPENALGFLAMIRELEYYSDMDVDAVALAYVASILEGSEELFDDDGRLVEDEGEWSRLAAHYALTEAQSWLDKHPEEKQP